MTFAENPRRVHSPDPVYRTEGLAWPGALTLQTYRVGLGQFCEQTGPRNLSFIPWIFIFITLFDREMGKYIFGNWFSFLRKIEICIFFFSNTDDRILSKYFMDSNCIGIVKLEIIRIECYFQKILTCFIYLRYFWIEFKY